MRLKTTRRLQMKNPKWNENEVANYNRLTQSDEVLAMLDEIDPEDSEKA